MNKSDWPIQLADCLGLERVGDIAVLSLARAHKRNALNDELVVGLQSFFASIPADVRGVVMQGTEGNFCAGLDLNELKESSVQESFHTSRIGQALNDAVQFCKVPVVAVLQGAVIGGGLELAAAAHVRIAEPSAYYALPEGTRGIFLGSGGSVRLTRLIGTSTVMEMMLTGRVYGAEEAYRQLRLSHYLVGEGEGLAKGIELAQKIARNAPLANFAIIQGLPHHRAEPHRRLVHRDAACGCRPRGRGGQGEAQGLPGAQSRQGAKGLIKVFTRETQVRFSHCDPAGMVYYPRYLELTQWLVEDWFTQGLGIDFADMFARRRIGTPVATLRYDFAAPSRQGDLLTLNLVLARLGGKSFTVRIEGFVGESLKLEAEQVLVMTSLANDRSIEIPEDIRAAMAGFGVTP